MGFGLNTVNTYVTWRTSSQSTMPGQLRRRQLRMSSFTRDPMVIDHPQHGPPALRPDACQSADPIMIGQVSH